MIPRLLSKAWHYLHIRVRRSDRGDGSVQSDHVVRVAVCHLGGVPAVGLRGRVLRAGAQVGDIFEQGKWLGSVLLRLPIASHCFLLLLVSPARV